LVTTFFVLTIVNDKWSQALSAAANVAGIASRHQTSVSEPTFTFVMPILLVSDEALWVVDYDAADKRGQPKRVENTTYYVARTVQLDSRGGPLSFHISHLHMYTRTGFVSLLKNLTAPAGSMRERIFGWAVRAAYGSR
jgi:hypothetical protein